MTNGAFDICKAALKHGVEANTAVSTKDSALGIVLNQNDQTIYFRCSGLKIDLGGIGKGLAMESSKNILAQAGIQNVCLVLGRVRFCH